MGNLPYFWVNKFGISDHTKARVNNVSKTTKGAVDTIGDIEMPYGKHCESFVHTFYFFLRTPFDKGSGRTEWFVIVSPVVGFLVFWITGLLKIKLPLLAYAACFFFPGIWLDALLWMAIFWAVGNAIKALKILFYLALLIAAGYIFTHFYK